jgi:hypothetical protein
MADRSGAPALVVSTVLSAFIAGHAAAAAQRTFVASTGNDANPCSLTLPCRALAAAVSAVATDGEVVVLDSAGYGPVTIARSVSIVAPPGVYAGVTTTAGNGVTVNGGAVNVALRGLTIAGAAFDARFGIQLVSGSSIAVENCEISNFNEAGIGFSASTAAVLHVSDTVVRSNRVGMIVQGLDGANPVYATISRSRIEDSNISGIDISAAIVAIADSVLSGNQDNVLAKGTANATTRVALDHTLISRGLCGLCLQSFGDTGKVRVVIMDSTISGNFGYGVDVGYALAATGCAQEAIVTRTQIIHNGGGVQVDGSSCATTVWLDSATIFENSGSPLTTEVTVANNGKLYTRQNSTIADITVTTGGTVVPWPAQ